MRSLSACEEFFSAAELACRILPLVCPMLMDNMFLVRSEAHDTISKYINSLNAISITMKEEEDKVARERESKQAAEISAKEAPSSPADAAPPKEPQRTSSALSMGEDEFVDALDGGWESPTTGWGDDDDDDDLGLTSPIHAKNANGAAPSVEDDFFSSWGESNDSPAPPPSQKELSVKPTLEQRRREAKKRREQRKNHRSNSSSMKLKGVSTTKTKKDGWDDWDF